jgi:hypothetical protein
LRQLSECARVLASLLLLNLAPLAILSVIVFGEANPSKVKAGRGIPLKLPSSTARVERVVLNALATVSAGFAAKFLRLWRFSLSSSSEKPIHQYAGVGDPGYNYSLIASHQPLG